MSRPRVPPAWSLPRRIDAVVFDMDGLLVDSEVRYRDAMMEVATIYGRELPLSVFLRMVGLPHDQGRAVAIAHFGPDFPIDEYIKAVWDHARAKDALGVVLKPGVVELLDHLDEAGLPRAVATSSSHVAVELQLGRAGLLPRFHAVVAAGDYPRGKPHPDPFLTAASRLGVSPHHCLALEDSHNGVRAAHAAGMMTVMVPDLLEPTAEMHDLCVAIAETLHHVHDVLKAA